MSVLGALLALIFAILYLVDANVHFDLIAWAIVALSVGILLDYGLPIVRSRGGRV